jgi:glycosyltransferase involved in cell wall biosynthesis
LDHGRFGRLVPIDDVDALANAMAEALTTPTDRELLRQRAADFSPDKVAEKYLQLLFPDS